MTSLASDSISPLVFSTSGGMGPIAIVVYKRIANQIAEKRDQPYNRTLFWIRCKRSFSLLRSAIMCIEEDLEEDGLRFRQEEDGLRMQYSRHNSQPK